MKIVYVDGFRIRNIFGDMDFNLMHGRGVSWCEPWFIPPGEIWLEKRAKSEIAFLLKVDRLEKMYYKRIGNYWSARKRVAKILCKPTSKNFILETSKNNNLIIRLVSGKIIRRSIDQSFVAGGHGLIYPWYIPKNEIWLDNTISPAERKYILAHEIVEYRLMKKGVRYNKAHKIACLAEKNIRARDGLTFYPTVNPIEPLLYWRLGNGKKRVLIVSGIHGDELSGPYAIAQYLLGIEKIPRIQIDVMPLINPLGFERNTRKNKEGKDINRWFFDKPRTGEPKEAKILKKYFAENRKPYDFLLSFHEDLERKEFYLYDIGNGRDSKIIRNIFGTVKKLNMPLYSGIDDIVLKNFAIGGYIPIDPQSRFPGFEEYLSRNETIKRGLIIEMPGLLPLSQKIALAKKILEGPQRLFDII